MWIKNRKKVFDINLLKYLTARVEMSKINKCDLKKSEVVKVFGEVPKLAEGAPLERE